MVHPTKAAKVTRGIEAGDGGTKNMDLAAEIDLGFDIIWGRAVWMTDGIEKGLKSGWEVGFIDVLRQLVEVFWILSFCKRET
jgi:hypothetical protein